MERLLLVVVLVLVAIWLFLLPEWRARGYSHMGSSWTEPILIQNLLTKDECQQIIDKVNNTFTRSTVVSENIIDTTRTSETAWIPRRDPMVQKLIHKAMELTGKPYENCEDIQVVRYTPGTYYRPHHDSCCEDNKSCKEFEKRGGQRVGTLLLYLNDDFTQGQTHFPELDLKLRADPGSAIFFLPMSGNACHPKALHAGLPIESGTKYVCNIWVREDTFN